ncbi:MAG: hypothetical protein ACREIA_01975, partial [Opitutaceae bacterium]
GGRAWWIGTAALFLALGTIASGASAAVAVLLTIATKRAPLKAIKDRRATLMVCFIAIALGAALLSSAPEHEHLHAGGPVEFALTFWKSLSEPVRFLLLFPLLGWLPWCLLARERWVKGSLDRPREAAFAVGRWVLVNLALAAFARGADAPWPPSRYMDIDAPAIRAALPPGVSPQAGARAWLSRGVELLMDFGAAWLILGAVACVCACQRLARDNSAVPAAP